MITLRPAQERGRTHIDWLDSWHSFSFGEYYDPGHMGFRALRVINDDRIGPAQGFGEHPHRDMEILTCVFSGELQHRDSLGNGSVIRPGDVQVMSAGTGIRHSEFNPSRTTPVHLLQIWMLPERKGLPARYDQKNFRTGADGKPEHGKLRLIASREGRDGSVVVFQDLTLWHAILRPGETVEYAVKAGRYGYVQVATGSVTMNGQALGQGDGVEVTGAEVLKMAGAAAPGTPGSEEAEVLVFDLA